MLRQTKRGASFCGGLAQTMVETGVAIAGPTIGTVFVVQVALGSLSRAVPRFGSTTLAFPLIFAAALIATALTASPISLPAVAPISAFPVKR